MQKRTKNSNSIICYASLLNHVLGLARVESACSVTLAVGIPHLCAPTPRVPQFWAALIEETAQDPVARWYPSIESNSW